MPRKIPKTLIVTDLPRLSAIRNTMLCTADAYLEGVEGTLTEQVVVFNLCRSYQYLSKGYYVSLLADARHQRVFPTLEMIEEINNPAVYFRALRSAGVNTIDFKVIKKGRRLVPKIIVPDRDASGSDPNVGPPARRQVDGEVVRYESVSTLYQEVTSIFGKTTDQRFRKYVAAVFKVYSFPLLRIRMYAEGNEWRVGQIFPIAADQLSTVEGQLLTETLTSDKRLATFPSLTQAPPHRIACLWDPDDPTAPSDEITLEKFARIAAKRGVVFERLTKDDLLRLAEHDALFIRTVTAVDRYSFTFSQTAESLGMPVIDDPQSIIRCANKVYLHELFRKNGIPSPKTITISRKTAGEELLAFGFPLIIKLPDGTFSQAVKKVNSLAEFDTIVQDMLKRSALLIVQEFLPTPFDWRIGILEGKILFTCKYYMAKDHWQILKQYQSGFTRAGKVEAVAVANVPQTVKDVALESAALIGDGFYGVDIKETETGALVIEVNDNPNLEVGYEDVVEKDRIYEAIIDTFVRRIHQQARSMELL
ncbi:MAG: RimK-like ATPgrasp N-terminal domain-containing protein [Candidatus Binatia bacterium]